LKDTPTGLNKTNEKLKVLSSCLNLRVKGQIGLGITISSRHRMDVTSDELVISLDQNNLGVQSTSIKIAIDAKDTGVNIELFKASFPYDHNYAEAIQNEFVSIFKWLKLMHKKKKVPFTADSPLPADLVIK
ncbi:unnamed protein product, partial [Timema podura]|nr:unnamed protein product [Timema podura]